ncbi:hypothetical protein [Tenacibaculum piscium]|uniref:hypothetical protein n=1 Tax=Tenacibaculum piscium TaxID=1458515 RepID=UPI001F2F590F|nr:hypothetical protein [Tenacibaculum piscium]
MILSEIGKIVETQWIKTFEMRPDMNLQTGEYIVMPNHFHAIITIGKNSYNTTRRDAMYCVSTTNKCIASLQPINALRIPVINALRTRVINSDHNQKIWHP